MYEGLHATNHEFELNVDIALIYLVFLNNVRNILKKTIEFSTINSNIKLNKLN